MDKKEANLLPNFCTSEDTSSSEEDESSDNEDSQTETTNDFAIEPSSSPRVKRSKRKSMKKQSKWTTYWNRYKRFVHSPRVHFVYDALFYFIFLILFSYMILCEFNYYEHIEVKVTKPLNQSIDNKQNLSVHELNNVNGSFVSNVEQRRVLKKPSLIEYLLIYWMFSFALEEFRQYFFGESETKILKNKLMHYFANNWNYLDISGCLVFSIGMSLRFISLSTDENLFIAARYLSFLIKIKKADFLCY